MRIAILTPYYVPAIGGLMYNVQTLAEKMVGRDHQVVVFTCNTTNSPEYEEQNGIKIYRVPCWHLLNGTFPVPKMSVETLQVLNQIRRWKPDVVNTQTRFFITTLLGWVFSKLNRISFVHTERGSCHSVVSSRIVGQLSRLYDHIIGYMVTRFASSNIGVSLPACEFVKHIGGKEAIEIPNGISMQMFDGDRKTTGKKLVFTGRLIEAKGVQDAIKVFYQLLKTEPSLEFIIAGDGPYMNALKMLTDGNVTFLGSVSREGVVELLREASVFINPSYSEGIPTSVMEAMAMGVPTVATTVGGTSELIEDHVSGILVAPKDIWSMTQAIKYLLSNEDVAKRMGIQAREKMKKYDWEIVADRYEEVFEKACGIS